MPELNLEEFPATSYDEWRKAAEESLKGAPFDKKLITRTHEGISLQPIYNKEDLEKLGAPEAWPGLPSFGRGPAAAPKRPLVAQEIPLGDPVAFNKAALEDFMRGQDALALQLDVASRRGVDPSEADTSEVAYCGLSLASLDDARAAFAGIQPNAIDLLVWAGATALPVLGIFAAHSPEWRGGILGDPLAEYARDGKLPIALDDAYSEMAACAKWSLANGSRLRTVGVNGGFWADAGATAIEELAFATATAVEYLRELDSRGVSPAEAAGQFVFTYGIGSNVFMEIAKLRAARMLWSRVLAASGVASVPARIHVRGTVSNKSALDVHTNMLRATTEAFVGSIAGADSMHVSAFDEVVRTPDAFSRRIARNVHTILAEECDFSEVGDPSGGSYYIETLTSELASKAWAKFQEIEKTGGMSAALREGTPQAIAQKSFAARASAAASRRDGYIGVNLFPDLGETPLAPDDINHQAIHAARAATIEKIRPHSLPRTERSVEAVKAAFEGGATLGQVSEAISRSAPTEPEIERVRVRRVAEGFEALRSNAARFKKSSGKAPAIWLANFGPAKQYKARADFSAGFLSAGGFEISQGPGAASVEDAVKAAAASKAPVVVMCSTDDTYPDLVAPFVSALRAKAPKVLVLLAGYPQDHLEAFKAAGINDFIHIRANCLEFLTQLQKSLGIAH